MKGSLRKFSFLLKKDKLGELCPFLSGCCSGGGDVCRWGRQHGSGEDKLKRIQEQNGKLVGL